MEKNTNSHNEWSLLQRPFYLLFFLFTAGCSPFSGKSELNINREAISLTWDNLAYSYGQVVVGSVDHKVFKITNNSDTTLVDCGDVILSDTENFNVLSNTCTSKTMAPQETCEVDIETRPVSSGIKTLTLERVCGGRFISRTNENMITVEARVVNMSWDRSGHDFGQQDVYTGSGSQIFTLNNLGDGVASSCSAPVLSDTVNFSISVDTCGTSNLIGQGSCAVTLLSHPRSFGMKQATLTRNCSVGGVASTTTNMIKVDGTGPNLVWTLNQYDFGDIEIGIGDQQTNFTLENQGTADATGCDPVVIDNYSNFWINDYCGTDDLAQEGSCSVDLGTSSQTEGPQSVTLSRTCTYGGTVTTLSQKIKFNGVHHEVQFSPQSFDFASNSAPQVFTFTNTGNYSAEYCDPAYLADDSSFSITQDDCSNSDLAIGASCQITVTPHPTSYGVQSTTLNRSCGGGQYSASATLSATGSIALYNGVGIMNLGRYLFSMNTLNDGRVLAMGGTGVTNNNNLNSVEMYDPNTMSWTTKASMNSGRNWVKSVRLQDGKILVIGGAVGYSSLNQVELYDPALDTWTVKAPLNVARVFHTVSLLADGKVLVAGGNSNPGQTRNTSLSSVEIYDPVLNTWTLKTPMIQNRYFHEAQTLQDGRVLVFGGDSSGGRTNSVEIYDPNSNTWTVKTSLNNPRSQFSSNILPNGQVIALGGYGAGALSSVEIYDPNLNTWSMKSSMSVARYYLASTVLQNGQVLVSGGMDNSNTSQKSVEIFDPALNTWTARVNMVDQRALHSSALLNNGQVLICGGAKNSTIFATCEQR